MPEGDSAYRVAHHLHRALAGRDVRRCELRMPALSDIDLRGERIHAAHSRGKHLLLRIGDHTLHSHLGMDGSWRIVPPGVHQRQHVSAGPTTAWPAAHRIRAIVGTDAAIALGIDLACLELWPTHDETAHLGWLGPDLLSADPDLDEAARRISATPDRPISAALLDQRNVAGLGNEYVTELCFLRGTRPDRPVGDIDHLDEWLAHARRLMLANRDRVARTFTGDLRQRHWVFGRERELCRRCGTPLAAGKHASGSDAPNAQWRDSVWCPHCQT